MTKTVTNNVQFYFGRGGVLYMRTLDGRSLKLGLRLRVNCLEAYDPVRRTWHSVPGKILNRQSRCLVHLNLSTRTSHDQSNQRTATEPDH